MHSLAPVELLEVPAAQDVHDELPSSLYVPTSHAVHSSEAVAEYVPAGHAVDDDAPVLPTKLPAAASLQVLEPSSSEYSFAGQSTHDPDPAPLYFPTGQASQALAPSAALE
jgi:hypothetical protein